MLSGSSGFAMLIFGTTAALLNWEFYPIQSNQPLFT